MAAHPLQLSWPPSRQEAGNWPITAPRPRPSREKEREKKNTPGPKGDPLWERISTTPIGYSTLTPSILHRSDGLRPLSGGPCMQETIGGRLASGRPPRSDSHPSKFLGVSRRAGLGRPGSVCPDCNHMKVWAFAVASFEGGGSGGEIRTHFPGEPRWV